MDPHNISSVSQNKTTEDSDSGACTVSEVIPTISRVTISDFPGSGIIIDKHVRNGKNIAISKHGIRMRRAEFEAMDLVYARNCEIHSKHIPLPTPMLFYTMVETGWDALHMDFIEGVELETVWNQLSMPSKIRLCEDLWVYIERIHDIPQPSTANLFACAVDGSASRDILLRDHQSPARVIETQEHLRSRIVENYALHNEGEQNDLPMLLNALPSSSDVVFSHGDIAPRNVMVRKNDKDDRWYIAAIIDWECAGFYPLWWDYACMMRVPSNGDDWMKHTHQTAPRHLQCDVSGIRKAFHRIM